MANKKMTKFQEWAKFFGPSRLAEKLGSSRQLVNQWINEDQRPSDKKKQEIVELSGGLLEYNDFFE